MLSHGIHARRTFAASVAALALSILFFALSPALSASAHDQLIGSDPAAGSTVQTLPRTITLTFSGVLINDAGTTAIGVTDSSGRALTFGDPVVEGTHVTQALRGPATGTITVQWRVVSSDGHPVSGEFTVIVGKASTTSVTPSALAPAEGAAQFPWWTLIVGALVVAGGIVILARRQPLSED